jgi:threonine aldolase
MTSTIRTVDLRSDTVTQPTQAMRDAMAGAAVGDDVYGEDPTVRRLEHTAAELMGQEAAIFVPTGTMGNQIAINIHSSPGSEVLLSSGTHVYEYELGAMAAWSGVLPRLIDVADGRLEPAHVDGAIHPSAYYNARASLLVIENTHNNAGGTVLDADRQGALCERARSRGLSVHLDGARIFNAAAVLGIPVARLGCQADSVMFCLSKGLGAPVGSLLCASTSFIKDARVVRKRMGGGMRQAGILAAAGLHALENNIDRLVDDHRRARVIADTISEQALFEIDPAVVTSNIVIAEVAGGDVEPLLAKLHSRGVLAGDMGTGRIRFVTHMGIDDPAIEKALGVLAEIAAGR